MADFVDRAGIEVPVVQAGMGGGMAGPRLAAAVSEAGGLGTLGMAARRRWRGSWRLRAGADRPTVGREPAAAQCGDAQGWMLRRQVVGVPFFSPTPPAGGVPDRVLETSPLYAGESAARIHDVAPAASIVRDLAGRSGPWRPGEGTLARCTSSSSSR